MKKNLGVDIDGVLTDEGDADNNIWHQAICEYMGKNVERKKDVFNFMEAYGYSEEVFEDFLDKYIEKIYENVKAAPGARKTLKDLKNKHNINIILMTARSPEYHGLTVNWLEKYQITYDKLIHEDNKAPLAQKINIELFIEDYIINARQLLSYGIPVILINKYHNQELPAQEKLYRADEWSEIRGHIEQFFNLSL